MGISNFEMVPAEKREVQIVTLIRETIQRAGNEKKYGRTVIEIVWVDGRPKTVEVTDKVSHKFE